MYKDKTNYETLLRLAHYSVFSLFLLKIGPFFLRNSLRFSNWYSSYMLRLSEKQ